MPLIPLPALQKFDYSSKYGEGFELGTKIRRQPELERQADAKFATGQAQEARRAEQNRYNITQRGAAEQRAAAALRGTQQGNQQRQTKIDHVAEYKKDQDEDILTDEEMAQKYPKLYGAGVKAVTELREQTQKSLRTNMNVIASIIATGDYDAAATATKDFQEGLENSDDPKDQAFAKSLDGVIKQLEGDDPKAAHKALMKSFGFMDYALGGKGDAYDEQFGRKRGRQNRFLKPEVLADGTIIQSDSDGNIVVTGTDGVVITDPAKRAAAIAAGREVSRLKKVETAQDKADIKIDTAQKIGKDTSAQQLETARAMIPISAEAAGLKANAIYESDRRYKGQIQKEIEDMTRAGKVQTAQELAIAEHEAALKYKPMIVGKMESAKLQAIMKGTEASRDNAIDRAMEGIEALKNHPGAAIVLGTLKGKDISTAISSSFSGDAADYLERLESLRSQIFIQARESLKGGGQITDFEGKKAQAAIGRLSTAKNPEDMLKAFDDLKRALRYGQIAIKRDMGVPVYTTRDQMDGLTSGQQYIFQSGGKTTWGVIP